MSEFRLRFDEQKILFWGNRYPAADDREIETTVVPSIRKIGYLTKPHFMNLCTWKSPRIKSHCEKNEPDFIQAVTETAFSTRDERLRIEFLRLLKGVEWPTASVILHFGSEDPYPILDFRALWSLGVKPPSYYDFDFWWHYTLYCRKLAKKSGVTMRVLDRALWQFSKENQKNPTVR